MSTMKEAFKLDARGAKALCHPSSGELQQECTEYSRWSTSTGTGTTPAWTTNYSGVSAAGLAGWGVVACGGWKFPGGYKQLYDFYPEVREWLQLSKGVPTGLANEFREGEKCLDADTIRAAAGMLRSVLDKTLRANGYKVKNGTTLEQQIDTTAEDGAITQARRRRAHEEIRVFGNDVLHDEWHEIAGEDVEAARHYAQRVLEDFYDDRESVLKLLREAGRVPDEDKQPPAEAN